MTDRFKNLCIYECTDPSRIKTDSKTTLENTTCIMFSKESIGIILYGGEMTRVICPHISHVTDNTILGLYTYERCELRVKEDSQEGENQ